MPRPFGWSDQFCIDELMRRYEKLEERLDALEAFEAQRKKSGIRPKKKPTAQGQVAREKPTVQGQLHALSE